MCRDWLITAPFLHEFPMPSQLRGSNSALLHGARLQGQFGITCVQGGGYQLTIRAQHIASAEADERPLTKTHNLT